MADMNTVNLIGNITRDAEVKTGDTWKVVRFGVAVEGYKDDEVHFFNVECWGQTGDNAERNVHKGRRIGLTGRLTQNRWADEDGQNRSSVSVVADDLYYLGPRKDEP